MQSKVNLSSPTGEARHVWRLLLESSQALLDLMDADFQEQGISLRWYDVLVHLDESPDGRLRMSELARQIITSTSGLTRVVDGMERAGLVRRERPSSDRRGVEVVLTRAGSDMLSAARTRHHQAIQLHFAQYLDEQELKTLARAFTKLRDHVRPLREQQIAGA